MLEYDILSAYSAEGLVGKVRFRVQQGWKPQGGVAVHDREFEQERFHQAVVRVTFPKADDKTPWESLNKEKA